MSNKQITLVNNCCSDGSDAAQAIKDFYNSVAEGAASYATGTDKFSPSGPTDKIMEFVKSLGKKRILDVGCGMGTTLLRLVNEFPEGTQFIGVDFSEKMIDRAREKAANLTEDLRKKVGFFVADSQNLPYMDGQFDLIYSECVFNLVPDRSKVMREIERLLTPGGILIYTDFVSYSPVPSEIREDLTLVCGCRTGSIQLSENIKWMERYGFQQIEIANFTDDKNKRYAELVASSEEYQQEYESFQTEHPVVFEFLEEKVGYYLIIGVKGK